MTKPEPRKRDSHIFDRENSDHYVEEFWCSGRLFETEKFEGPILDPACGWGRISTEAGVCGHDVICSDIVDRNDRRRLSFEFRQLDFLGLHDEAIYSWWMSAGAIVCNPPFNLIKEFVRRALALMEDSKSSIRKVAFICPLRRLPAASGWLETHYALSKILFMSPRPSMPTGDFIHAVSRGERDPLTGKLLKVGGGKEDFVWLIWEKGFSCERTFGWLHRDGENDC